MFATFCDKEETFKVVHMLTDGFQSLKVIVQLFVSHPELKKFINLIGLQSKTSWNRWQTSSQVSFYKRRFHCFWRQIVSISAMIYGKLYKQCEVNNTHHLLPNVIIHITIERLMKSSHSLSYANHKWLPNRILFTKW